MRTLKNTIGFLILVLGGVLGIESYDSRPSNALILLHEVDRTDYEKQDLELLEQLKALTDAELKKKEKKEYNEHFAKNELPHTHTVLAWMAVEIAHRDLNDGSGTWKTAEGRFHRAIIQWESVLEEKSHMEANGRRRIAVLYFYRGQCQWKDGFTDEANKSFAEAKKDTEVAKYVEKYFE